MEDIREYLSGNIPELILENAPTDDTILYWLGCRMLNWKQRQFTHKIINKYNIKKDNPRPGVLRFMRDEYPPIISDSKEIIKRSQWDLDSLIGETEHQLMHEAYYEATNHILKNMKRKHDVLTILQCSSSKPYYVNRAYKYALVKPYGDFSDFACVSNPGIIPYEYSDRYPFRYDEWNIVNESKIKDIVNLTEKYRIVNMCRAIRYMKALGYKHCIVYITNKRKQVLFERIIDHDVDGMGSRFHIAIPDSLRDRLMNDPKYDKMQSFLSSRMASFGEVADSYARVLQSVCKDKDAVRKARQERKEELNESMFEDLDAWDFTIDSSHLMPVDESLGRPRYRMRETLTYDQMMSAFKKIISDNMKDPSIDKGDNDLYYRSYYWTALDLVLYGLQGDLVEDIDKVYWDIRKKLDEDSDWEKLPSCIYAYKPLMEKDGVKSKDIMIEADKLKLVWHRTSKALNPTVFNGLNK